MIERASLIERDCSSSNWLTATRRRLRVRTLPTVPSSILIPRPITSVNEDKDLLISRMRHLRPSTEFRQHWQYNNLAYMVASTFPEHLYGTPFESYVHDHLLVPLGMNGTTYDGEQARRSGRRSDSFVRTGMDLEACLAELEGTRIGKKCQGELVDVGFVHEGRMNAGPGGVITCAKDMVRR